ncbi:MAG TPA: nucleotide exchange factor GrpE [Prolixibacteraceae bacterium]|nr:nucleotide exchange factor GrpE [Prolixibacteraceae bacterium]
MTSKKDKIKEEEIVSDTGDQTTTVNDVNVQNEKEEKAGGTKKTSKKGSKSKEADKIEELEIALAAKGDQFLRLQAEFDNYRKRTLKEKMEMIKTAGEGIMLNILPVIDDFERALQSMEDAKDATAVAEGLNLIYKRFIDFIKQNGLKEIEAKEQEFDTDVHEAITKAAAPSENLKGKIIDVIQKGYLLNDKVIRFAKVVIGE